MFRLTLPRAGAMACALGAIFLATAFAGWCSGAPAPRNERTAETTRLGTPILSGREAALRVRRTGWEPRPENRDENRRVPTRRELRRFMAGSPHGGRCIERLKRRITGNFTGTTDEIIQWVAWKWGIDEDIIRGVAAVESWWRQDAVTDHDEHGVPQSFGITSVRRTAAPGTHPLSARSTAFNLEYWAMSVRQYYEGCSRWLNRVDRGRPYRAGDIWGSVGAWYSGRWRTPAANAYIGRVRAYMRERVWEQPGF